MWRRFWGRLRLEITWREVEISVVKEYEGLSGSLGLNQGACTATD